MIFVNLLLCSANRRSSQCQCARARVLAAGEKVSDFLAWCWKCFFSFPFGLNDFFYSRICLLLSLDAAAAAAKSMPCLCDCRVHYDSFILRMRRRLLWTVDVISSESEPNVCFGWDKQWTFATCPFCSVIQFLNHCFALWNHIKIESSCCFDAE